MTREHIALIEALKGDILQLKLKTMGLAIALVVSMGGFLFTNPAYGQSYTFTDLGTLLGGTYSWAMGINNSGQVVGYAATSGNSESHAVIWSGSGVTDLGSGAGLGINNAGQVVGYGMAYGNSEHAMLWSGNSATDLGPGVSGATWSEAWAISDAGVIVGRSTNATNLSSFHATLWNGNTTTDLGLLGGTDSQAFGINKSGQVAGMAGSPEHATIWSGARSIDLGPGVSGWANSAAYAINNSGQVVGYAKTSGAYPSDHATFWNGATVTDLGTQGGANSYAFGINNIGQIVGQAGGGATLWDGTSVVNLNLLLDATTAGAGWVLEDARGINDSGWIVGNAHNSISGANHAYLLAPAPVPEPETYAMLLAGLGLLGLLERRKKPSS